jgi:LPXTG-motif cell wall-anchored protein
MGSTSAIRRAIRRLALVSATTAIAVSASFALATSASTATTTLDSLGFAEGTKGSVRLIGKPDALPTGLVLLQPTTVDDQFVLVVALSVDLDKPIDDPATYTNSSWSAAGLDAAAMEKINWIVTPVLLDEPADKGLGKALLQGDTGQKELVTKAMRFFRQRGFHPSAADDLPSFAELIAAVQAAVWHFSDGTDLDKSHAETTEFMADLYDFLVGPDNTGLPEPPLSSLATLSITPAIASGQAGTPVGPFAVSTTAERAFAFAFDPETGEDRSLVNAEGEEVVEVGDGDELFVDVPADAPAGSADVFVEAQALPFGQALISEQSGPLVVFDSFLEATATADWTAQPPTPAPTTTVTVTAPPVDQGRSLPETGGGNTGVLGAVGAGLVLGGVMLLLLARRARRKGI